MRTQRRSLVVLAAALLVTACGAETPEVDDSGAVGPDEAVTADLKLLQVQLAYPADGVYEQGEDVPLYAGISNTGTTDDDLVAVRGPDFADGALLVDGEPGSIPVPANDNVYVGAEGAPSVVLEDLSTTLRSSASIPVTFVFEKAGEVTIDAMVAAEGQDSGQPYDFPDPADDPTDA
ncbi:hypothetical protein DQ237_17520 [Blastococcus sp. TF02-8]|uniref:copper chaperone PCu(A)C n=1 Tax=Blastococcus sp. TF02-8 TaxID=2250574 RepID=UPI000DE965C7|nr:copper chaperone PCu(A)C [Blastococcus sp. TF02-8]RBY93581.1 hypothetical protein DQ237_17520 [Blastococcus sp. TF02-8]